MTDDQRELVHRMLESIIRAEEDPSIESLTKEDIWEETKSMTLKPLPKPEESKDTWEIMRAPMDVSKEMELLRHAGSEYEGQRIRDILEKAGPIRATHQIAFCMERCKVMCSKPEWCPFADNPFN